MINISKKEWLKFSETELSDFVNNVFEHYRSTGFPYYKLTDIDIQKELIKLQKYNTSNILDGDILKQTMLGLNLANFYMPHMYSTKCNGFRTPYDNFIDDEWLLKTIKKRIQLGDNMSDSGIRKTLSFISGSHKVSNFRPTIAKWVYDNFSGDGKVLDYSAGYGGRLLGAISSDKVISYTGVDPCLNTYNGLCEIKKVSNKDIYLYNEAFEDVILNETYDLSFSSPPYYNTEEYDYSDKQSFIRYKTKDDWKNNFLTKIIEKNFELLKQNGIFIINIANVKNYKTLEEDTISICIKTGFTLVHTYKMSLSSLMKGGFKYEPIFIFKKM